MPNGCPYKLYSGCLIWSFLTSRLYVRMRKELTFLLNSTNWLFDWHRHVSQLLPPFLPIFVHQMYQKHEHFCEITGLSTILKFSAGNLRARCRFARFLPADSSFSPVRAVVTNAVHTDLGNMRYQHALKSLCKLSEMCILGIRVQNSCALGLQRNLLGLFRGAMHKMSSHCRNDAS